MTRIKGRIINTGGFIDSKSRSTKPMFCGIHPTTELSINQKKELMNTLGYENEQISEIKDINKWLEHFEKNIQASVVFSESKENQKVKTIVKK